MEVHLAGAVGGSPAQGTDGRLLRHQAGRGLGRLGQLEAEVGLLERARGRGLDQPGEVHSGPAVPQRGAQTYSMLKSDEGISGFALASEFIAQLQQKLKEGLSVEGFATEGEAGAVEEEVEPLGGEDAEEAEPQAVRPAQHHRWRDARAGPLCGDHRSQRL